MTRKALHSVLLQTLFVIFTLGWLMAQSPSQLKSAHPKAQGAALRVTLNVTNAALPVTMGVPLSAAAGVLDATQLGVVDAGGAVVPTQTRVLARWGGTPNETSKAIKWLLVDFKPAAAGAHFLTRAAQSNTRAVTISDAGGSLRLTNSQLDIEFPKQGGDLVKSFRLGGAEMLRAPAAIEMSLPRRAIVTRLGATPDMVIVTDATLLRVGDEVRFEHVDKLKWDAAAGSARLVTHDQSFAANRRYRLAEGTPQQEDIEVNTAEPGDLRTATQLRFNHTAGVTIRDLSIEGERATIRSINGQVVQLAAPLTAAHSAGEKIFTTSTDKLAGAVATVERTTIEEANNLRVVVRQDGSFRVGTTKAPPMLAFTLRYFIYADQPFVRVRLRLMNNGAYGFGASRTQQPPFAQHAVLRSLAVWLPTTTPGAGQLQVLQADDAHARLSQRQSGASLTAGQFELAVPEFVENYPKRLSGDASGLHFDVLPDTGNDHIFDGARAKTTDFYLGRNTTAARPLTNGAGARLDPAYIAATGAVRPAFVEKRDWSKGSNKDPQFVEAMARAERWFASGYAVEASEAGGSVPPQSMFEYRLRGEQGEQFGWRHFGDFAWGDGYANVHYDLPFTLLREYLRTGDARAFQLGSEMARYRADWGQYRANDYWSSDWNFRGMGFYEKGDHGSYREPVPSHVWIEGMWLYWALTGDEAVRESAVEGSDAFLRMNFTYSNALGWNEPRWVGWPSLGLVVAYRYTGDTRYLNKAREDVYLLVQTEENFGRKGYYSSQAPGVIPVQPWSWGSYAQSGAIEYWRETGDQRVADYLVRIADWLIGKGGNNPPIKPGTTLANGGYLPAGASYYWAPDQVAADRSTALAGLCLPVLTAAARISNRGDLWERAQQLFTDYALYRDLPENQPVAPAARAVINFRSVLFAASAPKTYGQMGLTFGEYVPELVGSVVLPRVGLPAPPRGTPTPTPSPTPASTPAPTPTPTLALLNVALNRPATASSTRLWPTVLAVPSAANDGLLVDPSGKPSIWHSDSNTGRLEWWQVDLGQGYRLESLDILFRTDENQESTRRNFEVRASNDPNFGTSVRLAAQGEAAVALGQAWRAQVSDANSYRYVRVQKTKIDPDPSSNAYFNLAEVRLWAQPFLASTPAPVTPTPTPTSPALTLAQLAARKLLVGQSLNLTLARADAQGQPLQLSAANLPENARFEAATGQFSFVPASTQAGQVYQITFRAVNVQQEGSSARLDIAVATDGAPRVTLLSPGAGVRLAVGRLVLISWSSTHSPPARHQVRLSIDGGASYPTVLAELPGHITRYEWLIPTSLPLAQRNAIRLLVKAVDAENRAGVDYTPQDLRALLSILR